MSPTYNGWKNHETWCVHLWLTNDETEMCAAQIPRTPEQLKEQTMARHWDDLPAGICKDFARFALSEVNWLEIFNAVNGIEKEKPAQPAPAQLCPECNGQGFTWIIERNAANEEIVGQRPKTCQTCNAKTKPARAQKAHVDGVCAFCGNIQDTLDQNDFCSEDCRDAARNAFNEQEEGEAQADLARKYSDKLPKGGD